MQAVVDVGRGQAAVAQGVGAEVDVVEVDLVDRGGFTVAEPVAPIEALDNETVRDVKDRIRTGRKRR